MKSVCVSFLAAIVGATFFAATSHSQTFTTTPVTNRSTGDGSAHAGMPPGNATFVTHFPDTSYSNVTTGASDSGGGGSASVNFATTGNVLPTSVNANSLFMGQLNNGGTKVANAADTGSGPTCFTRAVGDLIATAPLGGLQPNEEMFAYGWLEIDPFASNGRAGASVTAPWVVTNAGTSGSPTSVTVIDVLAGTTITYTSFSGSAINVPWSYPIGSGGPGHRITVTSLAGLPAAATRSSAGTDNFGANGSGENFVDGVLVRDLSVNPLPSMVSSSVFLP
ncbi:MAG: hypothetical protein ACO1RT_20430 [Planctomycetaceae bacterium]